MGQAKLSPWLAGAAYFALVFALGFALGTARVLVVAPLLGETPATLVELPLMLAASWVACGWCLRKFDVSASRADRLAMGGFAFALLMLAETALSTLLMGRSLAEHFARYLDLAPALGLATQLLFAAFPAVRR